MIATILFYTFFIVGIAYLIYQIYSQHKQNKLADRYYKELDNEHKDC